MAEPFHLLDRPPGRAARAAAVAEALEAVGLSAEDAAAFTVDLLLDGLRPRDRDRPVARSRPDPSPDPRGDRPGRRPAASTDRSRPSSRPARPGDR